MKCQVILILTHKCNLKCKYCYEKNRSFESMSIDVAKSVLSRVLSDSIFDYVDILLFGGEPFLEFDLIRDICEWTWSKKWEKQYQFDFSTNGTVFTDESRAWLRKNAHRIKLCLSADGIKQTQDITRDNSFDSVDFALFKELWTIPYVKMTIGKESLINLYNNIMFFQNMGFSFAECNLAEGIDWTDEDAEIFDNQLDRLANYYIANAYINLPPILNLELWKCSSPHKEIKKCGIGDNILVYDCDGQILPCNYFTSMSFSDADLKKISASIKDNAVLTDSYCYENCFYFPICKSCYAADYTKHGCFGKHNENRCKMTRIQAYYSALIRANRVLTIASASLSNEEKNKQLLTIKTVVNLLKGGKSNAG